MAVDSSLRLLHIVKDEKFPDSAWEFFEAVAPGQNTYLLGTKSPTKHLEKVVPQQVNRFSYLNPKFIKSLSSYDALILHSLDDFSIEVLARIDSSIPTLWIGMGYDYYDLLSDSKWDLLKPETRTLVASYNPQYGRTGPRHPIKRALRPFLYPNLLRKKQLLDKVDLFAPVLKSEYSKLVHKLEKCHPAFISWNYGKTANLVDGALEKGSITGNDILVGNSATPTNNHLEVFQVLAKTGLPSGARVIVPLSYGDENYRLRIIDEGKRYFGERFKPITEIMQFNDYVGMLQGCATVIMNHLRQQAAGNLVISLFLGARVYLDPQNPLYEEYRNQGLVLSSIENLPNDQLFLGTKLNKNQIERNRQVLKSSRGRETHERNTEQVIRALARIAERKATRSKGYR